MLNRHRNERLPHIVVVTAEPLPSRLAFLCRGTGDIDAVYHVALDELLTAVNDVDPPSLGVLNELIASVGFLTSSTSANTGTLGPRATAGCYAKRPCTQPGHTYRLW